jgi:DNA-binding GntR family transcriptional regulator
MTKGAPTPGPQSRLAARQPRYMLLAQALMHDIDAGRHKVGHLLPTEAELGQQFNVSRHTVREAIRRLSDLGLVSAQAGVGTRVTARRPESHYALTAEGLSDLIRYVNDVSLRIHGHAEVTADAELAALLACRVGQKWIRMEGERFVAAGSTPIGLSRIYVAMAYRAAVDGLEAPDAPIYALIERRFGLQAREVRQEITAVAIEPEAARRLGVPPGSPGLRIVRSYHSSDGELFEVATNIHPADRFSYASTLRLRTSGEGER